MGHIFRLVLALPISTLLPTPAFALPPDAARAPLFFETNVGQADAHFSFVLRSPSFAAGFSPDGITATVLKRTATRADEDPKEIAGHAISLVFKDAKTTAVKGDSALKASV